MEETSKSTFKNNNFRNTVIAAIFLMATSAVGPGFLTQTAVFTEQLQASFAFVILATILLDIVVQLTIWRVIVVSQKRAQDIANQVFPGLGYVLAALIVFGGLAFNIGNIAGAGLGLELIFGLDVRLGALLSCLFAIGVFLVKQAGKAMDTLLKILGLLLIALTIYVAWKSNPPVAEAAYRAVIPEKVDFIAILILVGGTVGGYITFAGAHRLIDGSVEGIAQVKQASRSAVSGIALASMIRILLFLAALGVVSQGFSLDPGNPMASVFQFSAGTMGQYLFGVVLWSAAISSVIGASYTSVSFIKSLSRLVQKYEHWVIILFILISTFVFILIGKPVTILVLAGALNGLILPLAMGIVLYAAHQPKIMGTEYRHARWLTLLGALVALLMGGISLKFIYQLIFLS